MHISRQTRQNGYTLIELLLYIAITGLVLTAAVFFMMTTLDVRAKSQSVTEVNDQATYIMDYITRRVRNADSISLPSSGSSAQSVTLSMPNVATSPTVFSLSGTALMVREGSGSAVPLTNSRVKVDSITFTNLSADGTSGNLRIRLTLSYVNPSGRSQYEYRQQFVTSAEVRQ